MDPTERARLTELLAELPVVLSADTELSADLQRLTRIARRLIPASSGASVSMLIDGQPSIAAASVRVALHLDLLDDDHHHHGTPVVVVRQDVRLRFQPGDDQPPHALVGVAGRAVLSVLTTPAIADGAVVGSLDVYSPCTDAFDDNDHHTAGIIAVRIGYALARSSTLSAATRVRDRLQEHHDSVVVAARGERVLTCLHDCSGAQAANLLRNAATHNGEPVVQTAQRIIATLRHEADAPHRTASDERG